MKQPRLFTLLPEEYVSTPDSMAVDWNGDLILSCPNYATDDVSGCIVRIAKNTNITKQTKKITNSFVFFVYFVYFVLKNAGGTPANRV